MMRLALIAFSAIVVTASADTITQFNAYSNGNALWMTVAGTDASGDSIMASFNPGDIADVPECSCSPGQSIQVIEGWDGSGFATMNGVAYSGVPKILLSNEGGGTDISGYLPPITALVGSQVVVTFPITWNLDVSFWEDVPSPTLLFELKGSGTGTASADMTILQDSPNPPYYSGLNFTYTGVFPGDPSGDDPPLSQVPEPAATAMLGFGMLAMLGLARHKKRGACFRPTLRLVSLHLLRRI